MTHRALLIALAATGFGLSCTEPRDPGVPTVLPPKVLPPKVQPPNVRVAIGDDSLVMTAPGTARVAVRINDTLGNAYSIADTLAKSFETIGPFTAAWDPANRLFYRNMFVTATGAGAGALIVTAQGLADTIPLRAEAVSFQSVSVAEGFACAVAVTKRVWCWGDSRSGQLGTTTPSDCVGSGCQYGGGNRAETPILARVPQLFASVTTGGVVCSLGLGIPFVCGATCAVDVAGDASCWGSGFTGTIALPSKAVSAVVTPTFTPSGAPRRCFLLNDGSLYCLAQTVSGTESRPAGPVGGAFQYTAFDVGRYHSCGVRTDGDIYCWGSNLRGNLGVGTMDSVDHPTPQLVPAPEKFTAVEVGDYATCGLSSSGKAYCWGMGYTATGTAPPPACLGSSALCQTNPRLLQGGASYIQLSMSSTRNTVCGLKSTGDVDCWTANGYNLAPTTVVLPQPLRSISVGSPDSNGYFKATGCGVSTTDVLWCWSSAGTTWKVGQ